MIHPSHGVNIYVATKPVDFRKGHDGLAALVQSHLRKKPFDGAVYVFRAKRADRLKLIYWDGTGLVMAYKRLEQHVFKWPAIRDGDLRLHLLVTRLVDKETLEKMGAKQAKEDGL